MSGLIGLINFPPDQMDAVGRRITERLRRFEWDRLDWWTSQDRRLALGRIDIGIFNPLTQPVTSRDGKVVALFSGELYETQALRSELEAHGRTFTRKDDPELILNAYLTYGPQFVSRLEGTFHCAILDLNLDELVIANDRFGLRPLYWAQYGGRFVFGPEVKTILMDPAFEKQLSLTAVAEYVRFQFLLGDKTFIEGISLLPGASILRYRLAERRLTIEPYWDFSQVPRLDPKTPYPEVVEEAARLFQRAVDLRVGDSKRFGLYLTGGLDSRLIAACLAKRTPKFVTVSYGDKKSWDAQLSRQIAQVLKSDHHFFEFENGLWVRDYVDLHLELTEGHHSWIHMHGMSTLKDVRSLLDVNLTGWAVGGILGGHWYDPLLDQTVDDWDFLGSMFHFYNQRHSYPGITEAEEYGLYTDPYRPKIQGLAFESLIYETNKLEQFPLDVRAQYIHFIHHNRRLTQNFVIFNSSHFENRFPGHDYRLVDFVYSLPPGLNAQRKLEKAVINLVDPRVALIPQSKDGLLFTNRKVLRLSHQIMTRIKQRTNRHIGRIFDIPVMSYANYEKWLRNELRGWASEVLLDGCLAKRGIFNEDFVRSLLARHVSGREWSTIGKIAPIMTLEMVLQRSLDANPAGILAE